MMMLEREAGAKSYRALKPTLRGYFYTRALRRMILTGALHGFIASLLWLFSRKQIIDEGE